MIYMTLPTHSSAVFSSILSLWHRGTFGVVKKVTHRGTGEPFAAKFLPLKSSTRTRAFQERDLLSRIAHPRVACLLDFFVTRRTLVLVTEMYMKIQPAVFCQCSLCPCQKSDMVSETWRVCFRSCVIIYRCSSQGILDHLLMKSSVRETEVKGFWFNLLLFIIYCFKLYFKWLLSCAVCKQMIIWLSDC